MLQEQQVKGNFVSQGVETEHWDDIRGKNQKTFLCTKICAGVQATEWQHAATILLITGLCTVKNILKLLLSLNIRFLLLNVSPFSVFSFREKEYTCTEWNTSPISLMNAQWNKLHKYINIEQNQYSSTVQCEPRGILFSPSMQVEAKIPTMSTRMGVVVQVPARPPTMIQITRVCRGLCLQGPGTT